MGALAIWISQDAIELVDEGSLIDQLNQMEKRGVIEDVEDWLFIRELRNDIAHDYLFESNKKIQRNAYSLIPLLSKTMSKLEKYVERKIKKQG